LFKTTYGPVTRRSLLRFHTAQNPAPSGPIPTAGPVLKNRLLPVENLGSVHLLYAMAMGQGPLTASNSCACFNRNSSRLPSTKCLEAETAELIIFMLRYGPNGHSVKQK
jgi:hypothetical protein